VATVPQTRTANTLLGKHDSCLRYGAGTELMYQSKGEKAGSLKEFRDTSREYCKVISRLGGVEGMKNPSNRTDRRKCFGQERVDCARNK